MASQDDLDLSYLRMAYIWSNLSKARRKKVGCLIVKIKLSSLMVLTERLLAF